MSADNDDLKEYLSHFSPLKNVPEKYQRQLLSALKLVDIKEGETIIRKSSQLQSLHFLVTGSVEIRQSFNLRINIDYSSPECSNSLESLLQLRASVKANEDCVVLIGDREKIDELLATSQDYIISHLDEGELPIEFDVMIDDNFQEDWDNVFLISPLARNLSSSVIRHLFTQIEDVAVKADDCIVKSHSEGDYFYIIKKGYAEVQTAPLGPYKGKTFELGAGDYFGDEALVAKTIRNASVTMLTDGVLGRLDTEAFNTLIKQYLVTPLNVDIDHSTEKVQLIDIRSPMEFRVGHLDGSENIPISVLRTRLQSLQQSVLYIVSPANDSRSELATYLLRQAGFTAYQWSDGEHKAAESQEHKAE